VREAVIAAVTAKPKLTPALFAAIRAGAIRPPEIPSQRRTQLLKHADAAIRAAAEECFRDLEGGDRMAVYRAYRDVIARPGDPKSGGAVFARACAACHSHQGAGGKVGPDLTGVRHQPADALLLHILVPNYEVVPAYQTVTVTTDDGRSVSGWLAGETDTGLTLRTAAGTEETILRKNLAAFAASGLSLMPDGLEGTMTKDELGDLIAFLKQEPADGR
jgi:putative heme-binding domain-containing protein